MGRHLPYGITQCYLRPDTSERAPPNLSHTGWCWIYPPLRDGRLSWPSWLDSTPAGSRTSDISITSPTRTTAPQVVVGGRHYSDSVCLPLQLTLSRQDLLSVVCWSSVICPYCLTLSLSSDNMDTVRNKVSGRRRQTILTDNRDRVKDRVIGRVCLLE